MKKTTVSALLTACALFTGNVFVPVSANAAEKDDPELYQLAYSLGADTDYLSVLNYKRNPLYPVNEECYFDYLHNTSVIEAINYPNTTFGSTIYSGSCVGISILEVLAHNGIIKPSDIQEGAEKLSDITYNENSDRYITDYQALQSYTEFSNYERYLISSMTKEQKIKKLIETAEKCMKDNKYFLISIRSENFAHTVCGIGITDGKWTFNDKDYDKCVLVLDSNVMDEKGNPKGFSNQGCIYINSETNNCCIPSYAGIVKENDTLRFAVIDDDTLLNYKGVINGSEKIETDISGIKQIMYKKRDNTIVTPVSEDGQEMPHPEDSFGVPSWNANAVKADNIHFKLQDEEEYQDIRLMDADRWIEALIDHEKKNSDKKYNCDVDISDNKIIIDNNDDTRLQVLLQIRMNDGTYNFEPYYWWALEGFIDDELSFEVCDNGMLLKRNVPDSIFLDLKSYSRDENGHFDNVNKPLSPDNYWVYIGKGKDVLLSVDGDSKLKYFIDDNGDGAYDVPVRSGDVNCDGIFDASDASEVMSIYSELSTSAQRADYSLADFNSDGCVDACDASGILDEYAKAATGK